MTISPNVIAIAVADGAGSAAMSEVGAQIAVTESLRHFKKFPDLWPPQEEVWRTAVSTAFTSAQEAILDHALERGDTSPLSFATTLQIVLLGESALAYGRIGDGAAVARLDNELVVVGPPPDNVFVNETTFLTASQRPEAQVLLQLGTIRECAVFTDGLQALAMRVAEWQPHAPFFGPLFDFARKEQESSSSGRLTDFLESPQVDRRTDDDRTLVLAVWYDS